MEPAVEVKLNNLSQKMQTIANNYFFARNILMQRIEMSDDNFLLMIVYIQRVYACYGQLNEKEKAFINNEYFYQGYPNWWKKELSTSDYLKLKVKAIKHFLEVFYVSF